MLITANQCREQVMQNKNHFFLKSFSEDIENLCGIYEEIEKAVDLHQSYCYIYCKFSNINEKILKRNGFKITRMYLDFSGCYVTISWK